MQYCSLQRQTLLPSPVTSIPGHCFGFGFISSFFLELFLHSSSVVYQAATYLGSSSFSVINFLLFHTAHGVLKARILIWFSIPPLVNHILSELSTVTSLSWMALHGMAHSFIELDKAVVHENQKIFFKKIRDNKGIFHAKMGTIKERHGVDLMEAENIQKRWQEYKNNYTKKIFMTQKTMMV